MNGIMKLVSWTILATMVLVATTMTSLSAANGSGQTAADFLNIGLGARSASLGGAHMALNDAATASYWNPAALGSAEHAEISVSHFQWYQNLTVQQLSVAMPVSDRLSIGAHASMLQYGSISTVDNNGIITGEVSPADWVAGLSLGFKVSEAFSIGATGKMVSQNLGDFSASTIAGDLSGRFQSSRFTVAAGVFNLGSPMVFVAEEEKLPTTLRAGVAFKPFNADIIGLLDVNSPFEGELSVRQGIEFGFSERYYLRGGFQHFLNSDVSQQMSQLNLGAGVNFNSLRFDYAYGGANELGNESLHQFSLTFGLGKK